MREAEGEGETTVDALVRLCVLFVFLYFCLPTFVSVCDCACVLEDTSAILIGVLFMQL